MTKELTPQECVKEARHVTWVGFWCNAALGAAKIVAGVFASSSALIADGIHSFSDFVSDVIVLAMVGIARKKPDRKHVYGHGKYETLATILLSLVTCGGWSIITLIQGILMLCMSDAEFNRKYVQTTSTFPIF